MSKSTSDIFRDSLEKEGITIKEKTAWQTEDAEKARLLKNQDLHALEKGKIEIKGFKLGGSL